MSSITSEHQIRDVMPAGSRLNVESRAGAAFELLIGLSVLCDTRRERDEGTWVPRLRDCPAALRRAIERVGDGAGETWLHLLGLALELPAGDARQFVADLEGVEAHEFRRHLVGVHVAAWRSIVGAETLERGAAGDRRAIEDLLTSDRYYAGHARAALTVALPLSARQTKRRFVDVLQRFVEVLAPHERELVDRLEADAQRRRAAAASASPEGVIASATVGYVYEPEPEFRRVVLIPQIAAGSSLLLCQHREARIICHPAEAELRAAANVETRALALGKALGDPARIAILRRLAQGEASLTELAAIAGVVKSTAHHHLSSLRAARLVTVRGNARGYWYSVRLEGATEARALLGELLRA